MVDSDFGYGILLVVDSDFGYGILLVVDSDFGLWNFIGG